MKNPAKLIPLLAFFMLISSPRPLYALVGPVPGPSGIVTGVSAVGKGTWMVVKGVSGILWTVSKGVYRGASSVAHGVGHLIHHSPKESAFPEGEPR